MVETLPEMPFPPENDADADEVAYWDRVEKRLRELCDPLSRACRPKTICWAVQISSGQLSKELSGTDEKHLSARVLLYVARKTQHEELIRYIVCDLFGFKMPEKQNPPSLQEENERLRAENARMKAALRAALGEPASPVGSLVGIRAVPR